MQIFYVIILIIICWSCHGPKEKKSGIWLSFDDRNIEQWFELRDLFNENNVQVTFFITQPDSLTKEEIHKLHILQDDGHEIGFHGTMHVLSEFYIKEHGYRKYLNLEIDNGLETMKSHGFNCSSFAYPYGAKYWFTDMLLKSRFDFTRGVLPLNKEKDMSKIDDIYYQFDGDRTLFAMSFDTNSGLESKMIENGIKRCSDKNEILMLYAHSPSTDLNKGYHFNIEILEGIIETAKKYRLKFYTTETF